MYSRHSRCSCEILDDIAKGMSLGQMVSDLAHLCREDLVYIINKFNSYQLEIAAQNCELKLFSDRLEVLYDCAPIGYITLNNHSVIVEANHTMCDLTDLCKDSLIGSPFSSILTTSSADDLYLYMKKIFNNDKDATCKVEVNTFPSKWFELRCSDVEVCNNISQCLMSVIDITKRIKLEGLKDDVDRMMKHDLRSPLSGIIGIPKMLLESKTLSDDDRKCLMLIKESGYKLLMLLDNSLNIYKIEDGTYSMDSKDINVISLTEHIVQINKSKYKNSNINFDVFIDNDLVDSSCKFMVKAEETLCFSMLSNLITNAVESTIRCGGTTITISFKLNPKSMSITNNGCVPLEIRDKFFGKYVTYGKKSGTGLGAYSSMLIAKAHGWLMTLNSFISNETTINIAF